MKCINRCITKKIIAFAMAFAAMVSMSACAGRAVDMPYSVDSEVSSFNIITYTNDSRVIPFSSELCVITDNVISSDELVLDNASSAVLFDLSKKEVIYSKNAHERLYPASLTKIMTALVAIKNASLDQTLTASDSVKITESGAQLSGIKSGDKMTLNQALHLLLMYSANDAAMLIAENIGGTVENYVQMMNDEAKRLGATNTSFANPHGLTDEAHYTTAYDLYLIFNEAVKYETFNELIQTATYDSKYTDKDGKEKNISIKNTNGYINGNAKAPDNIHVTGGKTGTTAAAGHCLILLAKDTNSSPYIAVILHADSGDGLYSGMTGLLNEINK